MTRYDQAAQLLDLEGIATDGDGGFSLATEGSGNGLVPHALYNFEAEGEIVETVPFPLDLLREETR